MKRLATTLLGLLVAFGVLAPAQAQQQVTVRQINDIAQANVDQLMANGANMTVNEIQALIYNDLRNTDVQFTAVVLANPRNSGLSTPNADTGLPSRVHTFVRDTAAVSQGFEGMGIQLVDGSWQSTGLLNLAVGDVVTVVGRVSPFGSTMQIAPQSITVEGPYQSFGLPDRILDPMAITTADANRSLGDGKVQVNWENLEDLRGQYVRFEGATIVARDITDERPEWYFSTDGGSNSYETVVDVYQTSLRYRNDRNNSYNPDEFNPREEDFVPPPPGAQVNVQGFLTYCGSAATDFASIGQPQGALLCLNPWEDSDLEVTQTPPEASVPTRPDFVPNSNDPVTVTTQATADISRSIANVVLTYFTSADQTERTIQMTQVEGDTYSADIPAQPDGVFVIYAVTATDNTGAEFTTRYADYRVLDAGITDISHIQEVSGYAASGSPFVGENRAMDLTAVVMTQPDVSGIISIQDDPDLGPWTGIEIRGTSALRADLKQGDVINITSANIEERFDLTRLDNLTYTKVNTATPYAPKTVTTTALQDPEIAEAHEGMMLRIEDVTVVATNADDPSGPFGEFLISSDGTVGNGLRVDDTSSQISYSGNDPAERFSVGDEIEFIEGLLSYTFSNYKLFPETFEDIAVVVANEEGEVPGAFALGQNYPNPFNPVTTIAYTVPQAGAVTLEVFDLLGRSVRVLVNRELAPGSYEVSFDAQDLASGLYLYRLSAASQTTTRTMLLLK